jgi:Zn-dependent protease
MTAGPGTTASYGWRLGAVGGIPVYLGRSWPVIALVVVVTFAPNVQSPSGEYGGVFGYAVGIAYAVLLLLSVLAHEAGHAVVARRFGFRVDRVVADLWGGHTVYDSSTSRPGTSAAISVSGPIANLAVAAVGYAAMQLLDADGVVGLLLFAVSLTNAFVGVFNLLPGLPLDGGRLLRAGVWAAAGSRLKGTRVGAISGRAFAVLVALTGLIADRTTLGVGAGLLSILLAMYMWVAAGQALRAAEIMDRVPTVDIERLLRPGLLVPSDISVAEALRRIWSGSARGLVLVDAQDHPAAIVDEAQIASVPPDRRPWTQLSTVARPLESGLILPVGLAGEDLLDAVRRTPANEYLVVNTDGSPVGILSTIDLAAALRTTA